MKKLKGIVGEALHRLEKMTDEELEEFSLQQKERFAKIKNSNNEKYYVVGGASDILEILDSSKK